MRSTFSDVEALLIGDYRHIGIESLDGLFRRQHLRLAEGVRRVHDLALQVRVVDDVGVDDAEGSDARRREVERRGRAEAARADQEDAGVEQLLLADLADLGNQNVA